MLAVYVVIKVIGFVKTYIAIATVVHTYDLPICMAFTGNGIGVFHGTPGSYTIPAS